MIAQTLTTSSDTVAGGREGKVRVWNFVAVKEVCSGGFLTPLFLLNVWLGAKDLGLSGSVALVWSDSAHSP